MAAVQKPSPESPREADARTAECGAARGPLGGRRAPAVVLGVACLLFGLRLGALDLWAPDEPRYGAIAEELRSFRHGIEGLVLLHLNDVPYTQKPPLYFWLAALAGGPGGHVDELAARLPSALAALGCVALTALLGRWLLGQTSAAWMAAAILATSFRFAFTARRAQLDILLTSFELLAILIFVWLELRRGGIEGARAHRVAVAGMHAALGAAALVKGPVGWLPLAIFAAYLGWEGRLRSFRAISPAWAWLLSLGPVTVWIATAIAIAPPGFAGRAVGENLIGRFFQGTSHDRPIYYFAYQLPLDFLPWTALLPAALPVVWRWARHPKGSRRANRPSEDPAAETATETETDRRASRGRFLLVWMLVPIVFFSLSAGKRGLYLLPVFPALSMIAVVGGAGLRRARPLDGRAIASLAKALAIVAALELALFCVALPMLDREKSPRPIAAAAAAATRGPMEAIGVYGMSSLEGGIGYYSGHPIRSLRSEQAVERYLASGGRVLILRARHLDRLAQRLGLVESARLRSGERQIVVAKAASSPPESARIPTGS
jgi:4-amino-4-deoxy-L-arabinose transferase-like glycosyltransferase